jgi:hypothetical protein
MTLEQFHRLTAGMPASTRLLILDPWGELEPAAIITIEDLTEGDPLREDFPPDALVIAADAELSNRESTHR